MPLLLLFGGLLLALPHLVYPVLALDLLLWGLFAMALDLLLGYVGLLSFGHAAFWGTSAYTSALLAKAGLPFPLAVLGGWASPLCWLRPSASFPSVARVFTLLWSPWPLPRWSIT